MPTNCPYCGEPLADNALICKQCKNNRAPLWFARLQSHWSVGMIRALSVGTIVAVILAIYSSYSSKETRLRDRSQSLAEGMLLLQKTADELRQPCTLNSAADCRKRFAELAADFGASNYKFKEEARYLVDESSPLQEAIDFVDDFYNPGAQPHEHPLAELKVMPVQEAILRARDTLTEPYVDSKWCTEDHRETMRLLTASIDTYRYCANAIRRFIWTAGSGRSEAKVMDAKSFKDCVADETTVEKANKIHNILYRLDNLDYSAPWLFDRFCANTGTSITGGPVPTSTRQLVVAVADNWKSTEGRLVRYSRTDSLSPWRQEGEATRAMFGKNGLGWGRGLWQAPVQDTAIQPIKVEGDGRAPAGLFEIGPIYSEDNLQSAKMQVVRTNDAMYCDDNLDSDHYNLAEELNAAQLKICRDDKSRCPSELLRRPDGVYKKFFWIHHNDAPVVKGAGSCIFLHLDHAVPSPTVGCTTVSDTAMNRLIAWLDPSAHPLLLQLPKEELKGVIDLP